MTSHPVAADGGVLATDDYVLCGCSAHCLHHHHKKRDGDPMRIPIAAALEGEKGPRHPGGREGDDDGGTTDRGNPGQAGLAEQGTAAVAIEATSGV